METKEIISHDIYKNMVVISLCLWIVILSLPAIASAKIHDLGTFGHTYPIAEQDALKEIKSRAASVDWSRVFNKQQYEKAVKNYRPDTVSLPAANKNLTRFVDMTYTLGFDIPDGKGGVLYPKGYTFNPLKYTNFTQTIVVINGNDKKQVSWFEQSGYAGDYNTMLLLTHGSYYDLGKKLHIPIFYATTDIVDRLQLRAVPAVARQKGKYMEIRQIAIIEKKHK